METIIVTITDNRNSFFQDVEVPANLPMGKLKGDIIDTLNGYISSLNLSEHGILIFNNRTQKSIKNAETLEDAGVWNGDYLTIVSRRNY